MKTSNSKRGVVVGIFILIGLGIFVTGVLLLGGQQRTFERKIRIRAVFDDVGGLHEGNNVWFSGVKIGTVRKMQFIGTSQVEVTMNIEKDAQQYIRRNAKARISSEGFIGNKIVVIYGGTTQAPVIDTSDVLGIERGIGPEEIMATFQENNKNLLEITNDFKIISKKIAGGEGSVGRLLTDESLYHSLQSTALVLGQASASARKLTAEMADYASQLQRKGSLTNDLITDTVIFSRLRATALQMEEVAGKANAITNNLQQASSKLNDGETPIGTLLNDKEAAADLKITLKNLQSGTEKLDENMEALQHNFLLRGFFRKKAKREGKGER
jgi:phospholipid/cholesterol/gamma-HCH transport system substrate-binding protein